MNFKYLVFREAYNKKDIVIQKEKLVELLTFFFCYQKWRFLVVLMPQEWFTKCPSWCDISFFQITT